MLSGTPLVTTRLKGIPVEYFDFVFSTENGSTKALAETMKKALQYSEKELAEFGIRAQEFIKAEKNSVQQAKRILTFLEGLLYDSEN